MATIQTRKNSIIAFALIASISAINQPLHAKWTGNGPQLTELTLAALRGMYSNVEYRLQKDDSKSAHLKRLVISALRVTHDCLALGNHYREYQSDYLLGLLALDGAQMLAHGARIFKSSAQSNAMTTNANTIDDEFFLGEPEQEEVLEEIATPADNEPVTPDRLEFVRKYALPALESLGAVLVACTGHDDASSEKALFIGQALLTLSRICQMHLNQDEGDLKNALGGLAVVNAVYSIYQLLFPDSDLNIWINDKRRLEEAAEERRREQDRRREQERLEQEQRWRAQQQHWEDENRERVRQQQAQRQQQEAERERQRQERIRQQREQRQQQEAERERQRQERLRRQGRGFPWEQPDHGEDFMDRIRREQREEQERQERIRQNAGGFAWAQPVQPQEDFFERIQREQRERRERIAEEERQRQAQLRQRQEQQRIQEEQLRQQRAERERQRQEQLRRAQQAAEQQRIQEQQAQNAQRRENIRLNAEFVDIFPAVRQDLERGRPLDEIVQEQPFAILGLDEDADLNAVNRRYNRLALANHPDRNPNGHRAMQILNNARDAARARFER